MYRVKRIKGLCNKMRKESNLWTFAFISFLIMCVGMVSARIEIRAFAASENPVAEAFVPQFLEENADSDDTLPPPVYVPIEPIIIIDAGHGGLDSGCLFNGIMEKDINIAIAELVRVKLIELGYNVEFAREGDTYIPKEDRVDAANMTNAAIYVSIHQNSSKDARVQGAEVWYDGSDTTRDNERLASLVYQGVIDNTGAARRKMISNSGLYVTNNTNMTACLIETGFLSNAQERALLSTPEYREKIADGIVSGIDSYFYPRIMYLTFDGGPSAESTDIILDILKSRNIKATFFVIGEYVEKYPETARRIAAEGHTVGIYCYVPDYNMLYASKENYIADFERAYVTVKNIMGVEPVLFRFPGGSVNAYNIEVCQEIVEEMESRGFIYFDWNASIEDASGNDFSPVELIMNARVTSSGSEKVVLLAHDGVTNTALCLDNLIDEFQEYKMRPLKESVTPIQLYRFWEEN